MEMSHRFTDHYHDYTDLPPLRKRKCWWTLTDSDEVFDQSADQLTLLKEVIDYGARDEVMKYTEKYLWRHHLSEVPHLSEELRNEVASLPDSHLSGRIMLLFAPLLSDYGINHPLLQERILYRGEVFKVMLLAAIECLPLMDGHGDTALSRFYEVSKATYQDMRFFVECCARRGIAFTKLTHELTCLKALLEMKQEATAEVIRGAYALVKNDENDEGRFEFLEFLLTNHLAMLANDHYAIPYFNWMMYIERFPERAHRVPLPPLTWISIDFLATVHYLDEEETEVSEITFMENAVKHLIKVYGYDAVRERMDYFSYESPEVITEFERRFGPEAQPEDIA